MCPSLGDKQLLDFNSIRLSCCFRQLQTFEMLHSGLCYIKNKYLFLIEKFYTSLKKTDKMEKLHFSAVTLNRKVKPVLTGKMYLQVISYISNTVLVCVLPLMFKQSS